jgi:hypothetical protein
MRFSRAAKQPYHGPLIGGDRVFQAGRGNWPDL